MRFHAPYMEWSKKRPAPRFDLAGSNVLACTLDDLDGAKDALSLSGHNDSGYAPLIDAIASRYRVDPTRVTTASGTSGANFQVYAALLEPGDDLLIESGAIAAVAITFATYALRLVGRTEAAAVPLAVGAIVVLSAINYVGVKPGSRVLNVLVVLKVAALAILIGAGALAPESPGWLSDQRAASSSSVLIAFGAALVPILFAYGGWQNANYIAEEIQDPRRHLPFSLLAGTLCVVGIYLAVNVVYLRALGLEGLAATTTPASTAAALMFGPWGDRFVTAAIAISTFGFLDLAILAPTRVYYAMAADRVFFPSLAKLHPRFQTPWVAILIQSTWSCVLALTGRYEQLLNYVVFADWIFFGLTVATVIVFRRTHPIANRPPGTFRSPGYPYVQGAFVIIAAAVVLSVVRADPSSALRGALLLAAGLPVFFWFRRR